MTAALSAVRHSAACGLGEHFVIRQSPWRLILICPEWPDAGIPECLAAEGVTDDWLCECDLTDDGQLIVAMAAPVKILKFLR